jgi:hypothetical protein
MRQFPGVNNQLPKRSEIRNTETIPTNKFRKEYRQYWGLIAHKPVISTAVEVSIKTPLNKMV